MDILLNWLIALGVVLLIFAGLFLIIKMAVKSAVREAMNEVCRELARRLWEDDGNSRPAAPVEVPVQMSADEPEPQAYDEVPDAQEPQA